MSHRVTIAVLCVALSAPLAAGTFEPQALTTYVEQQPQPFGTPQTTRPSVVTPVAPAQETPPRVGQSPAISLESLGMRGFSVALVVGEMSGTATADSLPAGARKAITDMRDFLPYKSYRMLDASWSLCCAGRAGGTSGRLRGLEDDEYQFSVWVTAVSNNKMSVGFQLREIVMPAEEAIYHTVTRSERERKMTEAQRELEAAQAMEADLRTKYAENHPERQRARVRTEAAKRRVAEAEHGVEGARRPVSTPRANRQILDSSFSMEVGETVVIGTSRLKGDKALIALLTAASKTGGSTR